LTELNKKVFGKITTKEIIGAEPPALPDTKNLLENELKALLSELEFKSKKELEKLLQEQKISEKLVNSRPGAMALAQNKIQMYTEYSQKYIQSINQKLLS
jgi:hypothetical protein